MKAEFPFIGPRDRLGGLRVLAPAILALVLAAGPAAAQQGPGGRRMLSADERLAQMTEQLDLTDSQVEQLAPVVAEQTKKQQELFERASTDRAAMRDEMTKLRDETAEAYSKILTEEQMTKLKELQQQRMRRGRPPGRGR